MLVPKPKRAFQSPGVQSFGVVRLRVPWSLLVQAAARTPSQRPAKAVLSLTQPKMPPWALIISSPTRWNSGK